MLVKNFISAYELLKFLPLCSSLCRVLLLSFSLPGLLGCNCWPQMKRSCSPLVYSGVQTESYGKYMWNATRGNEMSVPQTARQTFSIDFSNSTYNEKCMHKYHCKRIAPMGEVVTFFLSVILKNCSLRKTSRINFMGTSCYVTHRSIR